MSWIERNIRWVMVVAGLFTLGLLYAFLCPFQALQCLFGQTLAGPVANMVVRNWGFLIGLVGGMILYGSNHPEVRRFVLVVTGISKVVFVGLVIGGGTLFLGHLIALAAIVDVVIVLLFAAYLWKTWGRSLA
ncbi:MAG TPA: hypothetical protein VGS57_04090 [Thermoanaerobaculia bacterium]|jgi:hypothetical protein|nr:hypothetical protein [Thermoanaerobaculia bacterium]